MILKSLISLYSSTIVFACLFQVSVKAQDSCDCTCLGTLKKETSVCDLLSKFQETLQYVDVVLEDRKTKIEQFDGMEKKLELHDKLIKDMNSQFGSSSLDRVPFGPVINPEPSNLIAGKSEQDDLNETQRDIRILEDKLNNVTSVLEQLDIEQVVHSRLETMKETLLQNHISELRSQLEEVAYENETKIANERLDFMETKLSDLIGSELISQMSEDIENFRIALGIMNETVEEKVQSDKNRQSLLQMHNIKLKELENLEAQVDILHKKTEESQYGLAELLQNIKEVENKTKHRENELVRLLIQSSVNETQRTADQLEKFKTEWILNCTSGMEQCFSLHTNQTTLTLQPAIDKNYMLHLKDVFNQKIQGPLYYGCDAILPENYPNLQFTRQDKNKLMILSCAKNTTLIGINSTQCQEGKWVPDTPPICVSKSTRPIISECPEIRVGYNSPTLMIVDESRKMVRFKCKEGKILQGPSFLRCFNNTWVPDTAPKCVSP